VKSINRFGWGEKDLLQPSCNLCLRYQPTLKGFKCEAFPNGIPDVIISGKNLHLKPYPGDNGKQFVLKEGFRREWKTLKKRLKKQITS